MSQKELYGFLEDRFECAQACAQCARACALRAGTLEPDGGAGYEQVRRLGVACGEVCEATCRALTEGNGQDVDALRMQLEWCRAVCLDCARVFGACPGAEKAADACRACGAVCGRFLTALD
ncbi:ferredoxin [Streptomyces sp. NPDC048277]|uniref:ferredoxin n=1 Tax=Streptomyces sp. NPDC048277 TaxID=3155027 RepID=UPI0033E43E83